MAKLAFPLVLALVAGGALAGCTSDGLPPFATTRQTLEDSLILLTVDSVSEGFAYGDLLVLANNVPYKHAAKMDHDQRLYEVVGKDNAGDELALGDVIRIPISGKVDIELRHRDGTSLQQLHLDVPDNTPPAAPALFAPAKGAGNVHRQALFSWDTLDDAAGVTYTLEYWLGSSALDAPPTLVSNLLGATYSVPADSQLLPGATYRWHVRAVDGVGNVGPWSAEHEFTTSM